MKCKECHASMVPCDRTGNIRGTDLSHFVCSLALWEFRPESFNDPWKPRVHGSVRIEEGPKHRKNERKVARRQQLPLFET